MAKKVVLDALIRREDFELKESGIIDAGELKGTLSIQDFEYGSFFYRALRKPDFQRETNEWEPEKVVQFIESYINGELIPSVILWKSESGMIFVIDGSHRISALAAWINDDYGDGTLSKKFFDNQVSAEQLKIGNKLREMISKRVGAYTDYKLLDVEDESPEKLKKVMSLGSIAVQVQWVKGDSKKAEDSFFKINEKASPINNTEKKLIRNRNKSVGIASRAIMRSGKGHKYWSKFDPDKQVYIQNLSTEIHTMLFKPEYTTPIKTLDLPIGGKALSYNGLALVNDTISICNGVTDKDLVNLPEDLDGRETIKSLERVKKSLRRINSTHPGSLGLHPAVYFYSIRGIHKVASYYGILEFVDYLEKEDKFDEFIRVRNKFEEILIYYEFLIQQIVRHDRQSINSYKNIMQYYSLLLHELSQGNSIEETVANVTNTKKFSYLTLATIKVEETKAKKFTRDKKTVVFMKESLRNANRCAICNGYLHKDSITIDHILRKQDGGLGIEENGQLAHPYCNSTFKN